LSVAVGFDFVVALDFEAVVVVAVDLVEKSKPT
jgi:hypothetical protein